MPGFDGDFSARRWRTIAPSDTANIEPRPFGVWIDNAGDLVAVDEDGNEATFKVPAGTLLPISPVRIKATGTSASGIKGFRP